VVHVLRLGIVTVLATTSLAACSTVSRPPTPTFVPPTETPANSPTPSFNSATALLPESLSWTGAGKGTITEAYATCHLQYSNQIYLHTTDGSVEFSLPLHAPGIVAQSFANQGASLHLQPGVGPQRYTLFLAASGSVTYSPDGISGSVNAWLAPQSNVPTSPSIHIVGTWRCG
jgi:hypothetical protein